MDRWQARQATSVRASQYRHPAACSRVACARPVHPARMLHPAPGAGAPHTQVARLREPNTLVQPALGSGRRLLTWDPGFVLFCEGLGPAAGSAGGVAGQLDISDHMTVRRAPDLASASPGAPAGGVDALAGRSCGWAPGALAPVGAAASSAVGAGTARLHSVATSRSDTSVHVPL